MKVPVPGLWKLTTDDETGTISYEPWEPAEIDIVFDGPPGPVAGRFVEVEDSDGKSIRVGKWVQREDGFWVLRILMITE